MLQTVISLIMNLITFIIGIIINIVLLAFPDFNLVRLEPIITGFYQFMNQGLNFIYFMFGETSAPIFINIITILITYKHITLPVVNLIRKFFIK